MSSKGRTRQLSIQPGMSPEMLRLISEQRAINKDLDRRKPVTSPTVFNDNSQRPPAHNNPRRIIFVRQANGSYVGQYSDGSNWQSFLATSVSFATPTITYATTASPGVGSKTIRSDSVLPFPQALKSIVGAGSTLTLTDDSINQTITPSLGNTTFVTAPGGSFAFTPNTAATLSTTGYLFIAIPDLAKGYFTGFYNSIQATSGASVSTNVEGFYQDMIDAGAVTFTTSNIIGIDQNLFQINCDPASDTGNEIFEFRSLGPQIMNANGGFISAETMYLGPPHRDVANPVCPTGRTLVLELPLVGSTSQFALDIVNSSIGEQQSATTKAGVNVAAIIGGTSVRSSFRFAGATTGTPTNVFGLQQTTGHTVGTNRYGIQLKGATTGTPTLCIGLDIGAHSVGTTRWAIRTATDSSQFAGITMVDATDIVLATGTGTKIGTATTQKLGFWNLAPVIQPATTGTILGFTAGGGAAVDDKGTFTGNLGATAYTISDIVNNLKTCGILKQ